MILAGVATIVPSKFSPDGVRDAGKILTSTGAAMG
jgi:hypothetical protein